MADPDRGAEADRHVDPRFDNWPVQRGEEHERRQDEHATPREEATAGGPEAEDLEKTTDSDLQWIGMAGYQGQPTAHMYDPEEQAVYEGRIDEENERVVVDEDERRDVESDESLAEHVEEIGRDHGWTWLSSIAHEFVDEDDHADYLDDRMAGGRSLSLQESEFQRKNVLDDADYDLAFFGSHTFRDANDRVHVLERRFEVYEGPDVAGGLAVEVEDRFLVAEEPQEERRAGDAAMVDKRVREIDVDTDPSGEAWHAHLEEELREFHENEVAWPQTQ